jgi:peptide/nickel transport system permease protein
MSHSPSIAMQSARHRYRLPKPALWLASGWLAAMLVLAAFAPLLVGDPNAVDPLNRLASPGTAGHPLGTDELGRDLGARIAHGARHSLAFGLVPGGVALLLGGLLGLVAGFAGRWVNMAAMRVLDVFYTFPPVLIALAVVGALGPGFLNCLVALTIYLIPPVARVTEAATVEISSRAYVDAARLSGATGLSILLHQVMPNVLPRVLAYLTSVLGVMIIIGAGLSFLGLGVSPPTAEWGLMLNELRSAMFFSPVVAAVPGLFIFLTAASLNLVGEAVERRVAQRRAT